MTLMFCAISGDALTLRVYGKAQVIHPYDAAWSEHLERFPEYAGARNIFDLSIDLVTTSCGTSMPEMTIVRDRATTELVPWYAKMSEEELAAFWEKKNTSSLDGVPTGIHAPEH